MTKGNLFKVSGGEGGIKTPIHLHRENFEDFQCIYILFLPYSGPHETESVEQ